MDNAPHLFIPRRHKADHQLVDYNGVEFDESHKSLSDVKMAEVELWLSKRLTTRLVKLFPGINWQVEVDTRGGRVVIKCTDVSLLHGHVISLERSANEIESMLLKVGGEILERGNMPRSRITQDDIEGKVRTMRDEVVDLDNS